MKKIKLIPFLFLMVFFSCTDSSNQTKQRKVNVLPYYNDASFIAHWIETDSKALDSFHRISDFNLVNQNGEDISRTSIDDKICIADFFFTTCPGICPQMTGNMVTLQDEFLNDDDVLLLSHSVTPERDSVEVLKKYAEEYAVKQDKWHLLTGDREVIYSLGRNDYFVEEDLGIGKDPEEFIHTENFVLIDKNQHVRGIYNGLSLSSIKNLVEDIATLKAENIQ